MGRADGVDAADDEANHGADDNNVNGRDSGVAQSDAAALVAQDPADNDAATIQRAISASLRFGAKSA